MQKEIMKIPVKLAVYFGGICTGFQFVIACVFAGLFGWAYSQDCSGGGGGGGQVNDCHVDDLVNLGILTHNNYEKIFKEHIFSFKKDEYGVLRLHENEYHDGSETNFCFNKVVERLRSVRHHRKLDQMFGDICPTSCSKRAQWCCHVNYQGSDTTSCRLVQNTCMTTSQAAQIQYCS